jgi:glutathionyl-hydroquinone reductase
MSHVHDDEFENATASYLQMMEDAKLKHRDTIKMLARAIVKRATEDEVAEIQDALDDKHADTKDNLPGDLDFDEHEFAWSEWVTDEIANSVYETQLASAIVGNGVEEIRELVLSKISAYRAPSI